MSLKGLFLFFACAAMMDMCVAQNPGLSTADSLQVEAAKNREQNRLLAAKAQFNYFVVKAESNTYGYDLYVDGNLYLHQLTVPGQVGNNGFADTATAGKTARLVIAKIKQGEMPPVITHTDLQQLGVLSK